MARRLTTLAHAVSSAFAVYTGPNRLRPIPLARPDRVLADRRLDRGFLLSTGEVAVLAGLPTDLAVPGLDRARAKAAPAPVSVPTGGRNTKVLGRAQIGGHAVALPVADARHHLHVLGATGTGKSTLLAHLILGDIAARRAVVLIDPKGDLARDVLDRIPDHAHRTARRSSTPTSPAAAPRSTRSRNAPTPTTTSSSTTSCRSSPRSSNATGDPASTTSCAWPA